MYHKKKHSIQRVGQLKAHYLHQEMMSLTTLLCIAWAARFLLSARFVIPPLIVSMWFISAYNLSLYAQQMDVARVNT